MSNDDKQHQRADEPRPGDEIAPSSYRKLPVEIKAIRWCGTNLREVIDFTGLHPSANKWTWDEYEEVVRTQGFKLFSLEGPHIVSVGDYVIRGVKGEFYACKPDIFWKTYQRATTPLPSLAPQGEPGELIALNRHPLLMQAYELSVDVDSLPAHPDQTALITSLSAWRHQLVKHLLKHNLLHARPHPQCPKCGAEDAMGRVRGDVHGIETYWLQCDVCNHRTDPE